MQNARRAHKIRLCGHLRRYKKIVKKTYIIFLKIIPLEYILELYSKYELLFVRMSFKEEKDKKIQRRHRWLVIKVCKLSVHKVLLFQKKYWYKMYSKMSVEGFEKLIEEFRNECDNER